MLAVVGDGNIIASAKAIANEALAESEGAATCKNVPWARARAGACRTERRAAEGDLGTLQSGPWWMDIVALKIQRT